ncbi:LamG domain-containing protein [Catellatospora coxensis]|uniref:LamG domain-containing protein n=1 Tax=Catellatospora coxensis TaxID=310354 RepID=UPI0019435709|nr:LamG domain-containing protein [Catellatospora coxensis]
MAATLWAAAPGRDQGGPLQASGPDGAGAASAPWTEPQAVAAARRSGKQVEVAAKGTGRQVTYANPDGSFTHESHAAPFRVMQHGKWVPVDTTMVRYKDGSVGPKAAETPMRFSGGGAMPLATMSRAGRVMSLSWPAALPEPVLSGDAATYRNVFPDVDLVVHATATSYTHVLVVKTPQAAALPQIKSVTYGLQGTNLTFSADVEGRLVARDTGSGGVVFASPTPKMWDSGDPAEAAAADADHEPTRSAPESARRAEVGVEVDGGTLRLTSDAGLLADASAHYPLYIDPMTAPTSNSSWAMVDSGYPNEEYWKFDGDRDQRIGLCNRTDSGNKCNNSYIKRLLYAIPTPYQDDTIVVSSATFKVTMVATYDGSARNASLYRMGSGITSATNWSNQPAWSKKQDTQDPTVTQGSCTSTNQNVTFTATVAAQEAAANNWSTTTFGIRADDETSKYYIKRFCDNAVLSVTYNRPPATPSNLTSNPGGACKTGTPDNTWYVSSVPKLSAYLSDPETDAAEPLTATFTVTWTPPGGSLQTKTWTSGEKANKSTFDYNLADAATGAPNLPENVVVSWKVQASDGTATSSVSATCGFILDKTKPVGSDIDSAEFLAADAADNTPACVESGEWIDGVGRYGTFTFDSAATDVVSYKYGFDTNPSPTNVLTPTTNGGPVSVSWAPLTEAPHFVTVIAVDAAGKESDTSVCTFNVAAGDPSIAQWNLADAPGSTQAVDERGANPASAGSGVTFGQPGPGGAAHPSVQLTGSSTDSYLAPSATGLVDTARPFTVVAWVKLDDLTAYRAAVSQDGTGVPGFYLGFSPVSSKWLFGIPDMDVNSFRDWQVTSTEVVTAQTGWTHLAVVFDPVKDTMTMYVNGKLSNTAAARSQWASHGNFQLGRRVTKTGYAWGWNGGLADVAVYDRLTTPAEIGALATPRLQRQVYWSLDSADVPDESPGVFVSAETVVDGATPDETKELTLYNGAALMVPDPDDLFAEPALVGAGHMVLDGGDDYAASSKPLVGQTGSFSVAARARLAAACASDQVVLSQPGAEVSRFQVKCVDIGGGQPRWQLSVAAGDDTATATTVVVDDTHLPDPSDPLGQHLVVTYNAFTKDVLLYVNGELAASAKGSHTPVWDGPDNGVQVGRALLDGTTATPTYGGYFSGVLDEVRVYSGVLAETTVIRLASTTAQSDL